MPVASAVMSGTDHPRRPAGAATGGEPRPGPSGPRSPDLPIPVLRGAEQAGAELADLGRFVRSIVRDELAAAEHHRLESVGSGTNPGSNRARPRRAAALAAEVLDVVRQLLGDDDGIVIDEEGDIPVRGDDTMLFVRVLDDPVSVLVFCPAIVELPATPALLERLNELNEGVRFVRFCATEDGVVIDLELLGDLFDRDMLHFAVRAVTGAAARFGPELQAEFGGRLFLDAEQGRTGGRNTAGYL
jgi:hypothetical protein